MKFLIVEPSLLPILIPLRLKNSPQDPVFCVIILINLGSEFSFHCTNLFCGLIECKLLHHLIMANIKNWVLQVFTKEKHRLRQGLKQEASAFSLLCHLQVEG